MRRLAPCAWMIVFVPDAHLPCVLATRFERRTGVKSGRQPRSRASLFSAIPQHGLPAREVPILTRYSDLIARLFYTVQTVSYSLNLPREVMHPLRYRDWL